MNKEDNGKDEFVGNYQTSLGVLMGSSKQKIVKELNLKPDAKIKKNEESDNDVKDKGKKKDKVPKILIRAKSESDSNNEITIEVKAMLQPMKTCCWKIGDQPYLIIERAHNKPEEWCDEQGNLILSKIEP